MSKYISALKVVDNHFKSTHYEVAWHFDGFPTYQEALVKATRMSIDKESENPIVRTDGLEFPKPKYNPIVLIEVTAQQDTLLPSGGEE